RRRAGSRFSFPVHALRESSPATAAVFHRAPRVGAGGGAPLAAARRRPARGSNLSQGHRGVARGGRSCLCRSSGPVQHRVERGTEPMVMRVNRTVVALAALCVAGLVARPALAQQGARRSEQSDARESWHEARRREAAERRAALLEWHRARRAGLAPRDAARANLAERHAATANAPALRTASLERQIEPSIVVGPE